MMIPFDESEEKFQDARFYETRKTNIMTEIWLSYKGIEIHLFLFFALKNSSKKLLKRTGFYDKFLSLKLN